MKARTRLFGVFTVLTTLILLATVLVSLVSSQDGAPVDRDSLVVSRINLEAVEASDAAGVKAGATSIYLIRLEDAPLAAYRGGIGELRATNPQALGERKLDAQSLASLAYRDYLLQQQATFSSAMAQLLGRSVEVVYRYYAANNGLAVRLTPAEAAQVAQMPGIVFIQPDVERELHTDAGPGWIGAPAIWDGSNTGGLPGTQGEGIVVGVIDTGVNPSNPSFADVGGDRYDHTNPRGSGNYVGVCNPAASNYDATFPCNDKLIGAWGYATVNGGDPRDYNGHGSHTASTAAGNVISATVVGPTLSVTRTISGVAPHANIIAYAACCTLSALTAAIDQVVLDNVDVVNYSIGSTGCTPSGNLWTDFDTVGYLNARSAGVFVATSAGNCGPASETLGSPADAPWILSVGATTHNRETINALINMSGGATAPPADIYGKSFTAGYGPAEIVYAGDFGFPLCGTGPTGPGSNPWPAGTFSGQIVICDRGTYGRVEKGQNILAAGAGGYILANDADSGTSLNGDAHVLPAVHITYEDGVVLKAWVADGGASHMGEIRGTVLDVNPAYGDIMASFSSRGANRAAADIIVPSVTAPGVDVIAAVGVGDPSPSEWSFISGTSMASPHAAGAAGLLIALHPGWTPAEVQSALMTTAWTDVLDTDGVTAADPFDMGSGRIDLTKAGEAGLLLNETLADYWNASPALGGDVKSLNLASLGDSACYQECGWTRSFRSTLSAESTWVVSTGSDNPNMGISVSDTMVTVPAGGSFNLDVDVDVTRLAPEQWHFGKVILAETGGAAPEAHLPIAVYVSSSTNINVLSKEADAAVVAVGETVSYTITLQNASPVTKTFVLTDVVPNNATYVPGSATGGLTYVAATDTLTWSGELAGASINVAPDASPGGYVSLAGLGVPPLICSISCDETIVTGITTDFWYLDEHYTTMSAVSNGYIIPGVGTVADIDFNNQNLPDPTPPNNVIAPLWTDIDMDGGNGIGGGIWYFATLTADSVTYYDVLEWENVEQWNDPSATYTFQIWIEQGTSNIWFVYNDLTGLAAHPATVGAENTTGTAGSSYYYDGSGTPPVAGTDLRVISTSGETATFTFEVTATGDADATILNVAEASDGTTEYATWAATVIQVHEQYLPAIYKQ